jgi:cytochrome c peroxidase
MIKFILLAFLMSIFGIITLSVISDDSYYTISKADVKLITPSTFPKPVYDFKNNKITPNKFNLGRKLFYDPILSKDSSVSCASCHQQFAAFAHIDHSLSHGINDRIGTRNVSAIQNLIWNREFMWDGGVNHIEIQPIAPITNKVEMNEDLKNIILKLTRNKDYRKLFKKAYHSSTITSEKILKSLAQFMGLMISANSRYDRFIAGNENFSKEEKEGLGLFKQRCASCHTEPLFTNHSYVNNGLIPNPKIDDKGRYIITGNQSDVYTFRVPSLRNVALTFPYMHDGRFRNLTEVLNFYSDTIKHTSNAHPLIKKIGKLSIDERNNILSFLKTLTDKSFIYDRRFADPNFKRL